MAYTVKEIFYTLQGEGANAGRAAVFLRFTGCNLWTGLEKDRENAVCKFCDTDFVGVGPDGGKFQTADELSSAVNDKWLKQNLGKKLVVCTGGEPLLQLDEKLINTLKMRGFEVAVETNGTIEAPDGVDWLCVSPKSGSELKQMTADELKLVYPQKGAEPEIYESYLTSNFLLQPMDGIDSVMNTKSAIEYCLSHPQWRLSVQTHKILEIR
jgi:7-carboxy-7-deazaguanine synthase (Cx14CxxC type)